jgi:hypothetical protein
MNIGHHEEANFCDNLVTILPGIWQILAYIGALACGCNSLKMLVDVVKCELALDGPKQQASFSLLQLSRS